MATIQGKIITAFEPRTGQNDRGQWMAQDFLLESFDQPYTRKCLFSVFGADRLQQFNMKEGDCVAVDVDIDAREYQGRYYNSVRAWRVTHIQEPVMQPAGVPPMAPVGAAPIGAQAPVGGAAPMSPVGAPIPPTPVADPLGAPMGSTDPDAMPF